MQISREGPAMGRCGGAWIANWSEDESFDFRHMDDFVEKGEGEDLGLFVFCVAY